MTNPMNKLRNDKEKTFDTNHGTRRKKHKMNTSEDDPTQRIIYQYFTLHGKYK